MRGRRVMRGPAAKNGCGRLSSGHGERAAARHRYASTITALV
ncbi:hypothetical protein BSIN_4239 [Burkholderia singularis]|uniref:Uncharacterized protein n=1 Tax=Burkholderia singularis TaxID=1503053 RepID=A0A238H7Y5_9BURK|nr:hypothetical protein BSIN_4239 [Burkholderia singularis]